MLTLRNEPVKWRAQRGNSSVGRARPCQGRGRGFESLFPLQFYEAPFAGLCCFSKMQAHLQFTSPAGWQSGYAADCKSAYAGSIPTSASRHETPLRRGFLFCGIRILLRGDGGRCPGRGARLCRGQSAAWTPPISLHGRTRGVFPAQPRAAGRAAIHRVSFRASPDGETGRRKGLKIPHPRGYVGSIPTPGTSATMEPPCPATPFTQPACC